MVASPLPDRDRRHLLQFYIAPKMDYLPRLLWAGGCMLTGFAIQLWWPFQSVLALLIVSLPLLLIGNLLLLVRGYNLRPQHSLFSGKWEKTTRDRFAKMRTMEQEVKKWDETATDLTCVTGFMGLMLVAVGIGIVGFVLQSSQSTRFWAPIFVADAVVLLVPHWITGTRRGWRPIALRQQIDALEIALAAVEPFKSPPCQIQPMFEMAGKGDRQVPINARVFIRFPDGPSDFLGVQFQVALNNVQGTNYPYLYAVIVAKKEFELLEQYLVTVRTRIQRKADEQKKSGLLAMFQYEEKGKLTIESSRESDVEVIVIRQHTTKQSGYHSKPEAIQHIARAAWHSAEYILSHSPHVLS